MGEGPDQWGQDPCPDFDLVGVPAANRVFGLDVNPVVPGTDEAAALLREDLAPSLVHADQTQVVPPGRYQAKEEDPGLDLLPFVELLWPSVRACVAERAARSVEERIVPGQHAPRMIRRRGELGVYLRDYDRTSRWDRKPEGAAGDAGCEIKRPLSW